MLRAVGVCLVTRWARCVCAPCASHQLIHRRGYLIQLTHVRVYYRAQTTYYAYYAFVTLHDTMTPYNALFGARRRVVQSQPMLCSLVDDPMLVRGNEPSVWVLHNVPIQPLRILNQQVAPVRFDIIVP